MFCMDKRRREASTLLLALSIASDAHAGAHVVRQQVKWRARAVSEPSVMRQSGASAQDSAPAPSGVESGLGTPLQLRAQAGLIWRSLDFEQDIYGRMRSQDARAYVYRVDATAFPFFPIHPLGAHLGLVAGYEAAFAGNVRDVHFGFEYPVNLCEWFAGVRARGLVRGHTLGFDLTLGQLSAGLDDEGNRAGTPDFRYTQVRSGLDFSFQLVRLWVTAAAGFRVPLGYGQVGGAEWFPRIGGYGLDATLAGGYRIAHGVSAGVSASLRRFLLEMNPSPEDPRAGFAEVAGGAIDVYVGAYAGLSFEL
jgi:hypothetical protein